MGTAIRATTTCTIYMTNVTVADSVAASDAGALFASGYETQVYATNCTFEFNYGMN